MTRRPFHRARRGSWSSGELRKQLTLIMDALDDDKGADLVSPLDVALDLLGGELEAFVLFGRMGHLDPPRPDEKVPIARLQRKSADPGIDETILDAIKSWIARKEQQS